MKYDANLCIRNANADITDLATANAACSKFTGTVFTDPEWTHYLSDSGETGATSTGVAFTNAISTETT